MYGVGPVCPKCGSDDIRKIGHTLSLRGRKQRYQCHKGHTFYAKDDYGDDRGGKKRGRRWK